MSTQEARDRFFKVFNGMKARDTLPPITVTPQPGGIPISQVVFDQYGGLRP